MTPHASLLLALPLSLLLMACNARIEVPALPLPSRTAAAGGPKVTTVSADVAGTSGICRLRDLRATFDLPMDPASIDARSFVLTDEGQPVAGRVSLDAAARTARFVPADPAGFAPSRTIVAVLVSGAGGVRSRAGQVMHEDRIWVFTTGWQACTGDGLHPPISRSDFSTTKGTT